MATTSVLPILPPERSPEFKPYLIDGFPEVHMRRNIIEWSESTSEADVRSWNLFLKALLNFQSCGEDPVDHPTGYYQIAGIHGAPYVHWHNEPPEPGDMPGNYCAHGSALFLTWHTPYQLLFEQRLVEEAIKYADSLSVKYRELYREAAKQIRFPYWDWATDARLPKPIRDEECDILIPQPGSDDPPQPIRGHNPLYSYRFQSAIRRFRDFAVADNAWRVASQTLRCPDHHGRSRPEVADRQLTTPRPPPVHGRPNNFRDGVHRLLTSVSNYGSFSNTGWPRVLCRVLDCDHPYCPTQHFSLEAYHNTVHVFTGNEVGMQPPQALGHMSSTAAASFDPIFWLHHANVDRLYAMWQAINYEAEFENQRVEATRLPDVLDLEAVDTHDSKLRPFYKSNRDPGNPARHKVWVSNMVQRGGGHIPSHLTYGYTYPELVIDGEPNPTPPQLAEHVRAEAQRLYGPRDKNTFHEPRQYPGELLQYKDDLDFRRAWNVTLKVKRNLILDNFTIFFFLRNPGEDARSWGTHDYRVGSFSTFKGQAEQCVNCANQEAADVYMKGGIDITEAIYYRLQQTQPGKNLDDEEEIVRLLKDELTWKLLDHETGQGIDLEEILQDDPKALLIIVTSFLVPYFKDHSFFEGKYRGLDPQLGLTQRKTYKTVTHDKRRFGGWSQGD